MKLWEISDHAVDVTWGYIVTNSDEEEVELEELCRRIGESTDYEFDFRADEIELSSINDLREEFSYELGD